MSYYNKVKVGELAWFNKFNVTVLAKMNGQLCIDNKGIMQVIRGDIVHEPKEIGWLSLFPPASIFRHESSRIELTISGEWRLYNSNRTFSTSLDLYKMPDVNPNDFPNWSISIKDLNAYQNN